MGLLDQFERGVGRQIEEAQKKGEFDNLPGKGKPLKVRTDPNVDPGLDAAYKILNENDYVLPWIEKGRQIDADLESARKALAQTWAYLQENDPQSDWMVDEWQRATAVFRERVIEINKLIRNHNLEIPNLRFERYILDAETEIRKISG